MADFSPATASPAAARRTLWRTDALRALEALALRDHPGGELMRRAAAALAGHAARWLRDLPRATPVLGLIGPGNNGGDTLLALEALEKRGYPTVALQMLGEPLAGSEADGVWAHWRVSGHADPARVADLTALGALDALLDRMPLILDGILGIGASRPLPASVEPVFEEIRRRRLPVLAVDVPSGLDASTGMRLRRESGEPGPCLAAGRTVTFLADKPGLHTGEAPDYCGELILENLDFATQAEPAAEAPPSSRPGRLWGAPEAAALARPRPRHSHKGQFGGVKILGGAWGMTGAALLAAHGAEGAGAGRIWIASPQGPVRDPAQPQWMHCDPDATPGGVSALCAGCGLGTSEAVRPLLRDALASDLPLVLDADGLNAVADDETLRRHLRERTAPTVLTPHPLEAARLLGWTVPQVQADRVASALAIAERERAVVVLKGAGSVVASPQGPWAVIESGSPTLAVAGTGDVLAGALAALLARGLGAYDAACLAAWQHGRAGELAEHLTRTGHGVNAVTIASLLPMATA